MRLKVVDINFSKDLDWIFKLTNGNEYFYIFNEETYKKIGISNPITKYYLDYLDVGSSVVCEVNIVDDIGIVMKMK
ncbi:MAG: hypothetical protein H6604_08135 [Flavobacteriales bacterium]|nr:hypothetical protein [Flavobacteriales bacterium]